VWISGSPFTECPVFLSTAIPLFNPVSVNPPRGEPLSVVHHLFNPYLWRPLLPVMLLLWFGLFYGRARRAMEVCELLSMCCFPRRFTLPRCFFVPLRRADLTGVVKALLPAGADSALRHPACWISPGPLHRACCVLSPLRVERDRTPPSFFLLLVSSCSIGSPRSSPAGCRTSRPPPCLKVFSWLHLNPPFPPTPLKPPPSCSGVVECESAFNNAFSLGPPRISPNLWAQQTAQSQHKFLPRLMDFHARFPPPVFLSRSFFTRYMGSPPKTFLNLGPRVSFSPTRPKFFERPGSPPRVSLSATPGHEPRRRIQSGNPLFPLSPFFAFQAFFFNQNTFLPGTLRRFDTFSGRFSLKGTFFGHKFLKPLPPPSFPSPYYNTLSHIPADLGPRTDSRAFLLLEMRRLQTSLQFVLTSMPAPEAGRSFLNSLAFLGPRV